MKHLLLLLLPLTVIAQDTIPPATPKVYLIQGEKNYCYDSLGIRGVLSAFKRDIYCDSTLTLKDSAIASQTRVISSQDAQIQTHEMLSKTKDNIIDLKNREVNNLEDQNKILEKKVKKRNFGQVLLGVLVVVALII